MLIYIIIGIIAVILITIGVIFFIRSKKFKPDPDKNQQKNQLNADLDEAGFAYENKGDYFYSLKDCWQRKAGYCSLYDEGAPLFNMIMDCEPIIFSYGGKRWLIELWKGQYGITTGGEIGVYNTAREDIHSEKFTGTFFEAISDREQLKMSFVLNKNGKAILKRKGISWWLTGFKLGEFSEKESLTMDIKIHFPNSNMCSAFVDALERLGYEKREFSSSRKSVAIHYDRPHSKQPPLQDGLQESIVQQVNKQNCVLYMTATSKYFDTLDRLEYVKTMLPELYNFMIHSLYAKGFFAAFDWIIDIIYGEKPQKPPYPQNPCCVQPLYCCHCSRCHNDCKSSCPNDSQTTNLEVRYVVPNEGGDEK